MIMKKLLTILLCLFILIGCSSKKEDKDNKSDEAIANYVEPDYIVEPHDYELPEYYHYEIGDFKERCSKLAEEAENGVFDAELYDELYNEVLFIDDLANVAFFNYAINVNNEENQAESLYTDALVDQVEDSFSTAANKISKSSVAEEYRKHLNNDLMYEGFASYNEKSQEEFDLLNRENELIQEYNSLSSLSGEYTATIAGKEYTFDFLCSEQANDLYNQYPNEFANAYYQCMKDFSDDCGEIYLELVQIRDRIAKLNGYDNFAEYEDKEEYFRNYDISRLDNFKDAIKEYGANISFYLSKFYLGDTYELTDEKLLNDFGNVLKQVSPKMYEYFEKFASNPNNYSIGSNSDRYSGSFMNNIFTQQAGVFFLTTTGSCMDYFTMAHEFGHFINASRVPVTNPIIFTASYDIFEAQSSGLELLFGQKAQNVFGDKQDLSMACDMSEKYYGILCACIYDDWQRYVYTHTDMSVEELDEKFYEIATDYGYYSSPYDWAYLPHNFDSPMYYLSYGVAYFTSLSIWDQSQTDFEKAVKQWEMVIDTDASSVGYFEMVDKLGLKSIENKNDLKEVIEDTLTYMDDVYAKYYNED